MIKKSKVVSILLTLLLVITTYGSIPVSAKTMTVTSKKEVVYEKLSKFGVTKSEVDDFSTEELDNFCTSDNISVDTKYYYVSTEGDLAKQVTYEEAQKGIKQVNYEKLMKDNFVSLMTSSASDTQTSSGGYLEQRVYIAQSTSSTSKYYVSYTATWLTSPLWTDTDVFGVATGNATLVSGSVSASYTCHMVHQYSSSSSYTISNTISNISTFSGAAGGIVNLEGSTDKNYSDEDHTIRMTFYVTKSSSTVSNISVAGFYLHQKSAYSVSPSITGISVSAGLSITKSSYFTSMTPNPYTVLYF